jgi:microsomal prostaglandin-E synthase 2
MSDKSNVWCKWSSERLSVVLYPNITRTFSDSWAAFAYVSEVKEWSFVERLTNRALGPVAMYLVRNKIKQKHGIVVSVCVHMVVYNHGLCG